MWLQTLCSTRSDIYLKKIFNKPQKGLLMSYAQQQTKIKLVDSNVF